ncbi:MAG: tRNA pseudouridine(55) synthase TruB, partial [Chloroflexota bacterium]|nr:tRNA pseudouridine(55) synthase TruB [Chloroflexota bacterium]
MTEGPSGFLVLYKPVGPTSQSLVNQVRGLLGVRRVGHTGTLDPFAAGVLPVAVGRANRLIERVHAYSKCYRAVLRFGVRTTTADLEGEVVKIDPGIPPALAAVQSVLPSFLGEIEQTPPAYSAAKVGGRRAYHLARAGETVQLKPRRVTIHSLEVLSYRGDQLVLDVTCSTGTYVRALG